MQLEQNYISKIQPYFPAEKKHVLEQAIDYAKLLYEGQKRYSGESYLQRVLRFTTEKILPLNPDQATIVAAILMNVDKSKKFDLDEVEDLFGVEVRQIVEKLTKINSIKSRYSDSDTRVTAKMFMTLADDFRVILIRLAERIDNMETLRYKSPEKQKANAREILDVYAPMAARLGLYEIALRLEELAFKHVYPEEYHALKKDLDVYMSKSAKDIEKAKREIITLLEKNQIKASVSGRIKNIYSIYKKLKKKTATLDDVFDIYAMRILLPSEGLDAEGNENTEKVYAVLALLHSTYKYLPERFKDYVANPKKNGYQSLHTAVIGLDVNPEKPTEIQIRTEAMHKFAENGVAAHWAYKESSIIQKEEQFLKALEDLKNNYGRSDARNLSLKMNLYNDKVFVLTPDNLVVDLPAGSTPIDFAYAIHTEVGHSCYLAKANNAVVPLDYELQNGEIVEIIRSNKPEPKLSWLSIVKTKLAKNRIKNYFKSLNDETLLDQGVKSLNEVLEKAKLPLLDDEYSFLKMYKNRLTTLKDREIILEGIGAGRFSAKTAFKNAYGKPFDLVIANEKLIKNRKQGSLPIFNTRKVDINNKLIIGGEKNIPYRLSSCCHPNLQDKIIGYITKTNGVSIHKINCRFIKNAEESRLLEARLENSQEAESLNKYQVSVVLEMLDQKNCLRDVVQLLQEKNVTILDFNLVKREGNLIVRKMIIDIYDETHLTELTKNLGLINGIQKVLRN